MAINGITQTLVLGAGLAGLAATKRLRDNGFSVRLLEKNLYVGGHAYSHDIDGFVFDEGPHVSFTKNPDIQALFANAVSGKFLEQESKMLNYWRGYLLPHPVQCNLAGLPIDLVKNCLMDVFAAHYDQTPAENNYADWCYRSFGKTFSEEFAFVYTRKYWACEPKNMSCDWIGQRIYKPKLEDVVLGALTKSVDRHHYLTQFRYPEKGGFFSFASSLAQIGNIETGCQVCAIDLEKKYVELDNGEKVYFESLISSLPLPELIKFIKDVPSPVREAAMKLSCTSVVIINIGIDRRSDFPDVHWMYFYDEDICFSRVSFPHILSPRNAPPGCGAIQAEIYHSRYRSLAEGDLIERALADLRKAGLIKSDDKILVAKEQRIPYANVLFDKDRTANLSIVRQYLDDKGIPCCGRYGEWEYFWTDASILSGYRAADKLLAQRAKNL